MTIVRFRDAEACEPEPHLLWDTVWVQRLDASGGYGDWILAGSGDQVESRGGLRAESALHTATLLQLFTDRRRPDSGPYAARPGAGEDSDPRGWWGNSIRLDDEPDAELGSLLWTLERGVITDRLAAEARAIVEDALAVLAAQGAVAATEVETSVDRRQQSLLITVRHYSQAGARIYEQRFGVLWHQSARNAPMNFGDRSLILA